MTRPVERQIHEAEERLRMAMLESDVAALDELLAPDLLFTNHLGQLLTKHDDISANRSGSLEVESMTFSEQQIRFAGDTAIVSVRARISGIYAGAPTDADLRFTRVWGWTAGTTGASLLPIRA